MLSGFIKIEDTEIVGIVSELPVFVSRTQPHNQMVMRKDVNTNLWNCTQSPSLSLSKDLKLWSKVILFITELTGGGVHLNGIVEIN